MRIAIASPVWGRFKTTELWWLGVKRLRDDWKEHEVQVFVSGSEEQQRALFRKYGEPGDEWLEFPNNLGGKLNACTEAAWKWGCDYAVILGSDDILTPKLSELFLKAMSDGHFYFGLRGCFMVEPATKRALYLTGHNNPARIGETIGAGRTVSKALLDKVQGRPWPDKLSKGADFRMTLKLQAHGIPGTDYVIERSEDAFLLDVKGGGNLWSYNHIARHTGVTAPDVYERIVSHFPPNEQALIRHLELAECPTCGTLRPW